ncbi:MAG TPA: preprotein translocase subunit SecE [Pirellulaceae bacterium]|mgnify:CR=1 FL=1|nr:preprotein translocase subunit SecE [Pirellulaceae bacterium]
MAKEKATAAAGLWQVMLQGDVYKRSQGRIARQVTFAALFALVLIGTLQTFGNGLLENFLFRGSHYVIGAVIVAIGGWASYRAVNYPRFADFLIAVEAEMNKVSWPKREELVRASIVVIFVILFLAGVLFAFDLIWRFLLGLVV